MSSTEDFWQITRPNVKERIVLMFNNDLLSDVRFTVRKWSDDFKARKVEIPAHKFVLSISSPVFFDMFHSQETSDVIELNDCEYENLLEMLRYIYTDEAILTGSNVMEVLHLSRRYKLLSLSDKCIEYLGKNLNASNVINFLAQALNNQEEGAIARCWEVIDKHTADVITSDEFVTVDKQILETLVERDSLTVNEVELFEAVNFWANNQFELQGLLPNGELKRRLLGERIVKNIRYPVMKEEEFANVVLECNILSPKECFDIIKHFSSVLTSPLEFKEERRGGWDRKQLCRFGSVVDYGWCYSPNKHDSVAFSVDQNIILYGIYFCGNQNENYSLKLTVTDLSSSSVVGTRMGCYSSRNLPYKSSHYWGFEVLFDVPLLIEKDKRYSVEAAISGSFSWRGLDGKTSILCSGVCFNFEDSEQSSNGTTVKKGQFPGFLFSIIK
ncbi:hypothetical protein ACROYT_G034400 [Oculina patagonica]